ncbi:MotA/TolQ/ExbB proton channel family protein [Oceanospirillum sp.]|uniref:MotA/TolQ/ExbB proton channel family protein n=1 Tax=Oceanospirillum sp. TaxID=2021254 RepID=UPI003A9079E2
MRFINSLSTVLLSSVLSLSVSVFAAGEATSVSAQVSGQSQQLNRQLLNDVQNFVAEDRAEQQARLKLFLQDKTRQESLLRQAKERLQHADDEQLRLKNLFDNNEDKLVELETLLKQRTGQLGEVFGVVKEQSAELKEQLGSSLVGAEFAGREQSLNFASEKAIPTMAQLQTLWFQFQHEMTHSGTISRFNADVADTDGRIESQPVLRVGTFNAINENGEFLSWQPERQQLGVLAGQPKDKHQDQAQRFFDAVSDSADSQQSEHLLVDVSSGQLLALIGQKPGLMDQIRQGGSVGYIILALGVMGLLTAFYKLVRLSVVRHKIVRQLKAELPKNDNPLGRVLLACQEKLQQLKANNQSVNDEAATSALNSTLDEALLKELPALESGQSMLKLLAAAAPLLGLLGTVTGMIGTFQSITLFGTSDPKLMAGGISQALITTVFGLIVAIPMLFSHGVLSSQSRALLMILQEKSLAQLNQLTVWLPTAKPDVAGKKTSEATTVS